MKYKYTFSVITVCYNAESCIEKTVSSIAQQDCDDFEYIVIDGLSTDDTLKRIKFQEKSFDRRIKIVSEKDKGLYDAMNKGVSISEGEYLIFINADDELYPGILSKIKNVIYDQKEKPDIIYGDSINAYYDKNNTVTKMHHSFPKINYHTLKRGMGVVHQSMFTKKTVFEKIGGFNLNYSIGADWDFLIRSVKHEMTMLYIPIPICIFPTDGISSGIHNMQRHRIRKENQLYKYFDIYLIKDIFNLPTMIQLFIGQKNFKKLRYTANKLRGKRNDFIS